MRRLTRDPAYPAIAKVRYVRLRFAFILEGRGAASRFAAECDSTVPNVCHCISGSLKERYGRPRRSFRLEQLADLYIAKVFGKHRVVLDWKTEP